MAVTLVAMLAIALGAAAVTTIYSVVNTVLLTPSPGIGEPAALVTVSKTDGEGRGFNVFSYPLYRDLRDRSRALEGLAAFTMARVAVGVTGTGAREAVGGM